MARLIERIRINVLTGLLLSALTCTAVWAQTTAQITGTVKDQSGAVLPGAEVTVTQTGTELKRNAVTDETGSYILSNLPIGPYRLEAALPGFRTYVQTGIVLQVNSNPSINAVLEVGQISDQVEVEANATLVETRNTGIGQVIDNVRVLELPLNGRQAQELIFLSGAAVGGGKQNTNRNYPTDSISVAGGMDNGLTYLLDGGTHNDPFNSLNLPLPFPDALQEFKVETSAVPAQYGQHSAGAINAVTKSGTNDLHGDLFEFVRNGAMNARNAFALHRDSLKRNQYGGVVGGPIVKNKLFFFGGFQGTKQRSAPITNFEYVPTAAMLAGDWTTIASPACNNGRQITLKGPFTGNRIDPALFTPQALNLLKHIPGSDDPCGQVQFGRNSNSDEAMFIGKADYQRNQKHSLFGRYEFAHLTTPTDYDPANVLTFSNADYNRKAGSLVLGDTYLIGAGTVNSFRATGLRTVNVKTLPDIFSWGSVGANVYQPVGYVKTALLSIDGGFSIGVNQNGMPGFTNSTVYQAADDISMIRGAHQLGFGANYIRMLFNVLAGSAAPGNFKFTAGNTGMGMGDFMLGRPNDFSQQNINTYYGRQNYIGLYLQDTWKATSRLTVNAGMRWEPYLGMQEKQGRISNFQQSWFEKGLKSTVYPNAPIGMLFPGDAQVKANSFAGPSHWTNFAPRLGLAWDVKGDGHMTVRAAYGIFNDYPHFYQYVSGVRDTPPWGYQIDISNPPGWDPWQNTPGGNPFPAPINRNIAFPQGGQYVSIPLNLKSPYVNQWNLSLQRQVGSDWLVSANYLGNEVVHLLNSYEGNPAVYLPGASCVLAGKTYNPCSSTSNTDQRRQLSLLNADQGQYYSSMAAVSDGGTRGYNGLLLSVQRRQFHGMTIQANYTLSHAIDDGTSAAFHNAGGAIQERRRANRGNSELDKRHNFNLSTVYETPQFSNGIARKLGSGWQVSGIVRILSGSYLTVLSGLDTALSGTAVDERPNQVLPTPYAPAKGAALWLNPKAFAQPATGTYGTMGASNVLGPASVTINMGMTRKFNVRENQAVEFRAEAFNIPNHVNLSNPTNLTLTGSKFGQIQAAADPRILQLALKYVF